MKLAIALTLFVLFPSALMGCVGAAESGEPDLESEEEVSDDSFAAKSGWVVGGYVKSSQTPLGLEAWGKGYAGGSGTQYKVCARAMLQFYIAGWVQVEMNTKCLFNTNDVTVYTGKTGCPAIGGANMRTRVHGWAETSTGVVVHDEWANSPVEYCPPFI